MAWPPPRWSFRMIRSKAAPGRCGRHLRAATSCASRCLGVLADHKGARTAAAVAEACDPETTEIHLIGYTEGNFPKPALKRMTVTGRYKEGELPGLIDSVAPHIVWFPAGWPETFSYTLSVAIESGLPIAATDIGSFPERLRGRPFTWLADHRSSPAEWIALFDEIRAALPAEADRRTDHPARCGEGLLPVRLPASGPQPDAARATAASAR